MTYPISQKVCQSISKECQSFSKRTIKRVFSTICSRSPHIRRQYASPIDEFGLCFRGRRILLLRLIQELIHLFDGVSVSFLKVRALLKVPSIIDPPCSHLVSCLFSTYPVLTIATWLGFIGTLPVLSVITLDSLDPSVAIGVGVVGGIWYRGR